MIVRVLIGAVMATKMVQSLKCSLCSYTANPRAVDLNTDKPCVTDKAYMAANIFACHDFQSHCKATIHLYNQIFIAVDRGCANPGDCDGEIKNTCKSGGFGVERTECISCCKGSDGCNNWDSHDFFRGYRYNGSVKARSYYHGDST